uniref:Uncharacterized protein n=1 Tax=Aliivibrio wodanis TaxID=80852 RepID=A0A5Q4ZY42_9GAMM|nr:hypothetical protein AW0309160_04286 [Aliivibrio wodanis]
MTKEEIEAARVKKLKEKKITMKNHQLQLLLRHIGHLNIA